MPNNIGSYDRLLRAAFALIVLGAYLTHRLSGTAALVLGAVAAVLLVTAAVGTCPLYLPFGISTRAKRSQP